MLKDALVSLQEMALDPLQWVNAQVDSGIRNFSNWYPNNRVKAIELVVVLVALLAFLLELDARREERNARMWELATDPRTGNSGKIPALEYLNKLEKPLSNISIPKSYLYRADLPEANLVEANLRGANLREANLTRAVLFMANLEGTNLFRAILNEAILNRANLSSANLGGAYLHDAFLGGANLTGANLIGANLTGANFRWSDTTGSKANLTGANLQFAVLTGALLGETNLSGANLSGTDLSGATLGRVRNLTQAMLDKACIKEGHPLRNLPEGLKSPSNICPA